MVADLYIRVSTEEQSFGYSTRYQEETLRAYCQGYLLDVGMVTIEDYSAKTFNRPAWNKLFTSYKSRKLPTPRILLFTKWDRFSRNTGDAYYMINQLRQLNIEVRAVEQPLDLSVPETKVMMAIFLAVPEVENERRGLNIKQGIQRGLREGRYMGKAPVGYANKITSNGIKYIEPEEPYFSLMRFAFNELAKGINSVIEVYRMLTNMGFDKSVTCLRAAIVNPVYYGKVIALANDNKTRILQDGLHNAIIPKYIFSQVQKVLSRKRIISRKDKCNEKLALRGILICPKCNKIMTGSGSSGRNKIYFYYHCKATCGKRFTTKSVDEEFTNFLRKLIPSEYFKTKYEEVFNNILNSGLKEGLARKLKIQIQIDGLNQRLNRARELLLTNGIDTKEYSILRQDILLKIDLLNQVSGTVVQDIDSNTRSISFKKYYFLHLDQLFSILDVKRKKEFALILFPYGVVYQPPCFVIPNLSESLRIIYEPFVGLRNAACNAEQPSADLETVDRINETPCIRNMIKSIHRDIRQLPIKQVLDIVNYFKKVVQLSISSQTGLYLS